MEVNAIYCKSTHEILYSRAHHDCVVSEDKKASIDGGFGEIISIGGDMDNTIPLRLDGDRLLKYILFMDWNYGNRNASEFKNGYHGRFKIAGNSNRPFYQGLVINFVGLRLFVEIFKFHPAVANLIAAEGSIISNFYWNNRWTFADRKHGSARTFLEKLLHFNLASAFGVVFIQTGIIFLLTTIFGKRMYVLFFFIATFFLVIYNFIVRYFYRLGVLDGWRGFVLSYLMAVYHLMLWIKIWEKQS